MGRNKWMAGLALVAGLAVPGASTLMAGDRWDDRDIRHDQRDVRSDYRDLGGDYRQVERLRADMARDQYRLNEDFRCGRRWAVASDERDLARDRHALEAYDRDIRHDRRDIDHDRRDLHRDYRDRW